MKFITPYIHKWLGLIVIGEKVAFFIISNKNRWMPNWQCHNLETLSGFHLATNKNTGLLNGDTKVYVDLWYFKCIIATSNYYRYAPYVLILKWCMTKQYTWNIADQCKLSFMWSCILIGCLWQFNCFMVWIIFKKTYSR